MKTLHVILIALATFTNGFINQDTETVNATFDNYEDGTYYFTDNNDESEFYTFEKIEDDVLKSYDLTDKKYEGKTFNVTYRIETEIDDSDDEYNIWIIVKLELVE